MTFIACPACHTPNPTDYRFCEQCGGMLPEIIASPGAPESQPPSFDQNALGQEQPEAEASSAMDSGATAAISDPTAENIDPNADQPTLINANQTTVAGFPPPSELDQHHNLLLTQLDCAAASIVGRTRDHNEDNFWFGLQQLQTCGYQQTETMTYRGAFILCDGMGGHDGGEIASALAIHSLKQQLSYFWANGLPEHETFQEYIHYANQVIWEQNQQQNRHRMGRMGTTLVMLLVDGNEVAVGHVGDSRVYCVMTDPEILAVENADSAAPILEPEFHEILTDVNAAANPITDDVALGANHGEKSIDEFPDTESSSPPAAPITSEVLQQEVTELFTSPFHNYDQDTAYEPNLAEQNIIETEAFDSLPQAFLEQLTEDHEVANQLIARGLEPEIAYARSDAHQLTQALGPNLKVEPTINYFTLSQNTVFLLCSDGLCDNDFVEQHWQDYLLPLSNAEANLSQGVQDLVNFADVANGHDNITALLVRCRLSEPPKKTLQP
jgi:serine/threonine protein phosphatase PrpC